LILEAEDLSKALKIFNEGFMFNGYEHRNLLKFNGGYLNEIPISTGFFEDFQEEEDKEKNKVKKEKSKI
jgi:hypothetical protein